MRIRSTMTRSAVRSAALAVAAVAVLAGCSTVSGTPLAAEIDVRELDTGSYPTIPLDMRIEYVNSLRAGTEFAIMRLADNVISGLDVDPKMKYNRGIKGFDNPRAATELLADVNEPVLERHKFMFGLGLTSADRAKQESKTAGEVSLTLAVLQFPDEQTAKAAARDLDQADFDVARDQNKPVQLNDYPDAHSHWRPGIPSLGSSMAVGSYVMSMLITWTSPDLDSLTELAEKTYAAQIPLLEQLPPLSKREALELPYDPDQMFKRALTPEDYFFSPSLGSTAVHTPRGILHWAAEPGPSKKAMEEHGVDRIAMTEDNLLWRTRDAAAAKGFAETRLTESKWTPLDAPEDVPGVRCAEDSREYDGSDTRYGCVVVYDRYVAQVHSGQPVDVRQRAAAQYALLANAQYQ